MDKKHISELEIPNQYISVFGSGNSINDLTEREIEEIKSYSFLITMNYAPIKVKAHLNMWSDKRVTDWMNQHYQDREKDMLFLARDRAFRRDNGPVQGMVDFWFNENRDRLQGRYTMVWLMQLLEKHFPDKRVMVFGLDMKTISNTRAKWYDDHMDYDRQKRGRSIMDSKLRQCADQINRHVKNKDMFINCTPESGYDGFQRIPWRKAVA